MLYPLSYEGKMLRTPWYVYLSGPFRQVEDVLRMKISSNRVWAAPGPHSNEHDQFYEALMVIFEETCAPIEIDLCREMTEHPPQLLGH